MALLFVVLALTGCAQLKPLAEDLDLGKPDVSVASVAIAGFDTEHADLLFTLDVDNGNPIAVPLSALAYDLRVAGQSLVSGNSSERIELAAGKVTQVPLTVSVAFADLRRIYRSLVAQDEFEYDLEGQVAFDLPVIGAQKAPLSASGTLPVPRMPRISLAGISLGKVGLTGADVQVKLAVENPNTFGFDVRGMNFGLDVNQQNWGGGTLDQKVSIPAKGKSELVFPLSLDFARIGQSGFQLLVRSQRFDYRLNGAVELDTTLPLVKNLKIPFDVDGAASSL